MIVLRWIRKDEDEVDVYVESVEEVSVVEESVGEEEVEEHDEQVENFAEDEPAEIYVVPERTKIKIWNVKFQILNYPIKIYVVPENILPNVDLLPCW